MKTETENTLPAASLAPSLELKGKGIARFHFWGEYHQSFAVAFDTPADAAAACAVLNRILQAREADCRFKSEAGAKACGTFATGPDVEKVEDTLALFGADKRKIGSMRYSCDHGELYTVTVPLYSVYVPAEGNA